MALYCLSISQHYTLYSSTYFVSFCFNTFKENSTINSTFVKYTLHSFMYPLFSTFRPSVHPHAYLLLSPFFLPSTYCRSPIHSVFHIHPFCFPFRCSLRSATCNPCIIPSFCPLTVDPLFPLFSTFMHPLHYPLIWPLTADPQFPLFSTFIPFIIPFLCTLSLATFIPSLSLHSLSTV